MMLEFQPKLAKILELMLYLAHRKPGADKYQVVKFFYLADREHLARYGRPITSERYFALVYGPVASKAKDFMEQDSFTMREAGITSLPFDVELVHKNGPEKKPYTVLGKPKREVDMDMFSKSDIRVFDEVIDKYGDCDFEALFKITHDHAAYKKAWARRGRANRGEMKYEEMIEASDKRQAIIADIGPVSRYL